MVVGGAERGHSGGDWTQRGPPDEAHVGTAVSPLWQCEGNGFLKQGQEA